MNLPNKIGFSIAKATLIRGLCLLLWATVPYSCLAQSTTQLRALARAGWRSALEKPVLGQPGR